VRSKYFTVILINIHVTSFHFFFFTLQCTKLKLVQLSKVEILVRTNSQLGEKNPTKMIQWNCQLAHFNHISKISKLVEHLYISLSGQIHVVHDLCKVFWALNRIGSPIAFHDHQSEHDRHDLQDNDIVSKPLLTLLSEKSPYSTNTSQHIALVNSRYYSSFKRGKFQSKLRIGYIVCPERSK
jgi:hypothetical protein